MFKYTFIDIFLILTVIFEVLFERNYLMSLMMLVPTYRAYQKVSNTWFFETDHRKFFLVMIFGAGEVIHIVYKWIHEWRFRLINNAYKSFIEVPMEGEDSADVIFFMAKHYFSDVQIRLIEHVDSLLHHRFNFVYLFNALLLFLNTALHMKNIFHLSIYSTAFATLLELRYHRKLRLFCQLSYGCQFLD